MKPTKSLLSNHNLKALFPKKTKWACWLWTALGTVFLYVQLICLPSAFSYLETFPLTCLLCTCTLILQSEAVHWKIHESKTKLHNRANKIWGIQENMEKVRKTIIYWISAAAAESLQSCPTLCDPTDSSPPGSPIPGILQARTLEWVAISFSNAWKWKVKVKSLSHFWLFATPWIAAHQASPSMGFSRQEYWSGVPLPSPY